MLLAVDGPVNNNQGHNSNDTSNPDPEEREPGEPRAEMIDAGENDRKRFEVCEEDTKAESYVEAEKPHRRFDDEHVHWTE